MNKIREVPGLDLPCALTEGPPELLVDRFPYLSIIVPFLEERKGINRLVQTYVALRRMRVDKTGQ